MTNLFGGFSIEWRMLNTGATGVTWLASSRVRPLGVSQGASVVTALDVVPSVPGSANEAVAPPASKLLRATG